MERAGYVGARHMMQHPDGCSHFEGRQAGRGKGEEVGDGEADSTGCLLRHERMQLLVGERKRLR